MILPSLNALDSLFFFRSEIVLAIAIFTILMIDFFIPRKKWLGWLSLVALVIAFSVSPRFYPDETLFFNFYAWDPFTFFFKMIAYATIGLTILASLSYEKIPEQQHGELYILLLAMALLLTIMGGVTNLLMVFIAIESVSLTSYLLVGFQKFDKRSSEASLKYLLFGAVSSAIMLFGMSLLFGAAQSIDLAAIGTILAQSSEAGMHTIILLSMMLILTGIGFKISMVPFHMWAPDVYQGAPTPITAFLTVAPKALGFAVLARVLLIAFPGLAHQWTFLATILAILTMTVGNLVAIVQTDVKRLIGYSSIAQAGYILVGIAVASKLGLQATLVYVVTYLFTNLGAFFTVLAIERNAGTNQIDAYNGLSVRNPILAAALTLFLLSLAGIPPLAGFVGKIYIFSAAVSANSAPLAIAIALNSAVAAYYYFKVVRAMYLVPATDLNKLNNPLPIKIAVTLTLAGVFLIGLWPTQLIQWVEQSILMLPLS